MTLTKRVLVLLACLMSSSLVAQEAKVTQLMSKDLTNIPGKEGLIMQVRGGKEVTLTPGQTFYEGPDDVHIVGKNASKTKPAKFVVFLVKDKGAPVVVPAK
jgi:hypothetical protein